MDKKTALRFVKALRHELEAITLQAKVSIEQGIGINNEPDADRDSWKSLDMYVDIVYFEGWPTSKNDPDTFAFGEVSLSHPLLASLSGRCLPIPMAEISCLPEVVCRMAASVLDGQQFKVRLIPTEQELVSEVIECADKDGELSLEKWDFLSGWDCLEAWNEHGAVQILLGDTLEEVFKEEILDRLRSAVAPK